MREGQVFGSRTARSAHGLGSGAELAPWKQRAACAVQPDRWFEPRMRYWATAAHICLRHCPVLQECGLTLLAELRRGVRPVDGVVAGVRFSAAGQPRRADPAKARCPQCVPKPTPVDWAQVAQQERDIAAYARLRQERDAAVCNGRPA